MAVLPKISAAEMAVMRVLWAHDPMTANEVVDALLEQTGWNHRTIRTLLGRLAKKQAVGHQEQYRPYRYLPLVSRDEVLRAERACFVKRVYSGAIMPMLAEFIEDEQLSENDVQKLRTMLARREGDRDESNK